MYSLYILRNLKNQLYVGSSSHVEERIPWYNIGQGAEFTKSNKDFKLVYEEKHLTLIDARRREKQ